MEEISVQEELNHADVGMMQRRLFVLCTEFMVPIGNSFVKLISVYKNGKPTDEALELLWQLLYERDQSVNISHRKMPTKEQHIRFVESRPYRHWLLIVVDEPVGAVYITKRNELGIFILKDHQSKGYGMQALQLMLGKHKPLPAVIGKRSGNFIANINPSNEKSKRLFKRLGFTHISEVYELS